MPITHSSHVNQHWMQVICPHRSASRAHTWRHSQCWHLTHYANTVLPKASAGQQVPGSKRKDSTNSQRHTPDLWASFRQQTQFIMTEDPAHNYGDSSSQAGNCVGASQAEVSMGRRLAWYPFKCFQAGMEVYIGEGMAMTARAVQVRPKEPGQKNMKAN